MKDQTAALIAAIKAIHSAFNSGSSARAILPTRSAIGNAMQLVRDIEGSKFQNVFCSQCGNDFGPGNEGFSDCRQHRG